MEIQIVQRVWIVTNSSLAGKKTSSDYSELGFIF